MTDGTETQPQGDASAATPPVSTPVDVEALKSEIRQALKAELEAEIVEARVKPLQRQVSERDEAIQRLKTAGMSESELEQSRVEQEAEENRTLRFNLFLAEQALADASVKPVAETLRKLYVAETQEEQLSLLRALYASAAPQTPAPAAPEAEAGVSDATPPNPASSGSGGDLVGDKASRLRFLENLGEWWPTR